MMALAVAWIVLSGLMTLVQIYAAASFFVDSNTQDWPRFLIYSGSALLMSLYVLAVFLLAGRMVFQLAGA